MKQFVFLVGAALGLAQIGSAAPTCVSGTLASYISLGSGGCMIGADILNSFRTLSGITGATAIAPSSISITPSGSTTNPGLMAQANVTAQGGALFEALISYQITAIGLISDTISLSGVSVSGDGNVTDIQDFCRGGSFGSNGVSGCTGTPGELLVLNLGSDKATFPATSFLTVTHDFTLDSGLSGTASGGTITDQFVASAGPAAVPEPASMGLAGLGIALLAWRARRIAKNR